MKRVISLTLSLVMAAGAFAAPSPQAASDTTTKKKPSKKPAVSSASKLDKLEQALEAQQQQIQQLRDELQSRDQDIRQLKANQANQQTQQQVQAAQSAAAEAQQRAAAAEATANEEKDTVSRLNSDLTDVRTSLTNSAVSAQDEQKRVSALEGLVERFRFNGDVRIRGENFNQETTQDRNRARIRARFGFEGKLNEDFQSGIYLATGTLGDPTTTNETLANVFDRKTIGVDRAWITYNPVAHRWLSLTGGKFAYQWQRTSVTGDPDLNPEGFDEKLSFDFNKPWLKNFTVQTIQLLYNEVSAGQDSYSLGSQISAKLQFGPWSTTPSFLVMKWNRPDAILQQSAFAVGATTAGLAASGTTPAQGPFNVPGEGQGCAKALNSPAFAPCVFAPNGMTNATFVDAKGNLHFYSGYNYADFILNNQFQTGIKRLPVNLLLELEDNLDAEDHPLDAKGKVLPGLGSQNKEYGLDVSVGQVKSKGDVQVGYAWYRQEQDSVIASFAESDQRAPSNILQNKIYGQWKLRPNTTAGFTWWRGRALNTYLENNVALFNNYNGSVPTIKTPGQQEPYLNRLQFDLIYAF